jgi:hypothetical protein
MFPDMGNIRIKETPWWLGGALGSVTALLPASWRLDVRTDDVVELTGPNGVRAEFAVEAERSGSVAVRFIVAALQERARLSGLPLLFVSDYIGLTLREALSEAGMSFADATGWVRVSSEVPLILLTGQGATRSPNSRGRISVQKDLQLTWNIRSSGSQGRINAVRRLNGVATNRIICALSTADVPLGVRTLAGIAKVSAGSVSKLLATLAAESIVDRDEAGAVTVVRRRALIRRWVSDYSFAQANQSVRFCIAPRGLGRVLARIGEHPDVAITGSAAARRLLPESTTSVVPLRLLALYASDPARLITELGLIEADPATANIVIARPQAIEILASVPQEVDVRLAPVALVLADLLTLPGRSDAEAEQLMGMLATADTAWKA